MELQKFRTILHIRGKYCFLATRSHTQFDYIYEIPKTCLLLLNYLEMRSQKSWKFVTPSSQESSNLPQLSSRTSRDIRKIFYLYPLVNSCFLFSFGIKNCLSVACHRVSCLANSVDHKGDPHCHQNYRDDKKPQV